MMPEFSLADISMRVCINLAHRRERWEVALDEFQRAGIDNVIRFEAIDGSAQTLPTTWPYSAGAYGCLRSHVEVVRAARDHNHEAVLIFEDDVELADSTLETLNLSLTQLPDDWELLYLGAFHDVAPQPYTTNLKKIIRSDSTYAYIVHKRAYDLFLSTNEQAEAPVDTNNRNIQKRAHTYLCAPHLAWVRPGYSDAQEKFIDHWYLKEGLALGGAALGFLAHCTLIIGTSEEQLWENAERLREYYLRWLPDLEVLLTDVRGSSGIGYNSAASKARPQSQILGFMDSRLLIPFRDLAGQYAMCERYARATGYARAFPVKDQEFTALLGSSTAQPPIYDPTAPAFSKSEVGFVCSFLRRTTLEEGGGWQRDATDLVLVDHKRSQLQTFAAPNSAFVLL